jgi:predicted cobalt transporter CbtA
MYRPRYRNIAVTLAGAGTVVFLYNLHIHAMWGSFEVDNPTLFARLEPMWSILLCTVPGVGVGLFVTRRSLWFSGVAYALGALIGFYEHGGNGSIAVGHILPERQLIPYVLREIAIFVVIGAVMGLLGAWLRHRLTIGSSDHGAELR